jgi:hypothetical protein
MHELISVKFTGKEPCKVNTPHTAVNIPNASGNSLSASTPNSRHKSHLLSVRFYKFSLLLTQIFKGFYFTTISAAKITNM